jgi:tRNA pseudouridine55 synthase
MSQVDGLAVIDKPAGCTSHDVVARCRRIFGQRKVGHAGTLDPDATGVLLVGLGQGTRLLQFLSGLSKRYTAEVVLGVATATLDASGTVTGTWDMSGVTLEAARAAAATLTGEVSQVPPMVSAIKVGGRRLHELARAGVEVERAARPVTVMRFDVELVPASGCGGPASGPGCPAEVPGRGPVALAGEAGPVLSIDVECSSGTYVRSLAADLGAALGGGAHLRKLRRLAVGDFLVDEAMSLAVLETLPVPSEHVLGPAQALRGMARRTVGTDVAGAVGHGKVLPRAVVCPEGAAAAGAEAEEVGAVGRSRGKAADGPWAVLSQEGALLAVYEPYRKVEAKPVVVLAAT